MSWRASTSSGVVGYYEYRATAPNTAYAKLLASPVSGLNYTDYTDGSVASGATYLYVVTAVDAQGVESAYSGSASAVIP